MLDVRDNLAQSVAALRAHKLRVALTVLGLTMGVTTLITVMTLVQGANTYVEQKIATLGSNVFQLARTPFAVTDFKLIVKSLRYRKIDSDDMRAVAEACTNCRYVGASATAAGRARYGNNELLDVSMFGHTPNMAYIDTRIVVEGRYFTDAENQRSVQVCLIGDKLREEFFAGASPLGEIIRLNSQEFTVIGVFEKLGSVLGQEQDRFSVIPMETLLRLRGRRSSLTINALADSGRIEAAQDEARLVMRARRHIGPNQEEDFFIGTKDSYIALWQSISSAFFAVFVMVSAISAVVGGIVIMNVMLVSVTERTKEIGVRRAVGATQRDILRQFLAESLLQCLVGGFIGIVAGFACALALRSATEFPADVRTWVAVLGFVLSTLVGLFFGIYSAIRAARLDPVTALRSD